MNGEYRFDIVKLFSGAVKMNGAFFTDAGNIWLTKPSKDFPGGEFHLNKFGSDIAVSSGFGLRFDAGGFFVLRADLAMPVRKPDYIMGDGWVLDKINLGDPDWRKQNLVLNVAIGYPF
jgi:outer membrane protein assembly factor BamA